MMMNDHEQLADNVIKMLEQKKDEGLYSDIIEIHKSDIDLVLEALHWCREGYITYRDELSAYLEKYHPMVVVKYPKENKE